MSRVTCSKCTREFERNESTSTTPLANAVGRDPEAPLCYNCALDRVTGGSAPEEGDFNTALLISGTMSDDERRWLLEDLRAVEGGSSDDDYPDDLDVDYWYSRYGDQ